MQMKKLKALIFLFCTILVFSLFGDGEGEGGQDDSGNPSTGKQIGGEPVKSWADGSQDFFVMFNSNLDDLIKLKGLDEESNPQGDTCLESSKFKLTSTHLPKDAIIEEAYLIWMTAIDPDKLNPQIVTLAEGDDSDPDSEPAPDDDSDAEQPSDADTDTISDADSTSDADTETPDADEDQAPAGQTCEEMGKISTDNKVTLSFTQSSAETNINHTKEIVALQHCIDPDALESPTFDFESIVYDSSVSTGCSDTEIGESQGEKRIGYYTYRVNVTDFFAEVAQKNENAGNSEDNMFHGDYVVSGIDCTDHDYYKCNTTMVSTWALVVIYRSQNIRPKKIYFYNGLGFIYNNKSVANVTGFELPNYATARLTTYFAEGDPSLIEPTLENMEEITIMGDNDDARLQGPYVLTNSCNPREMGYTEVYNSQSSIAGWDPNVANPIECVTGGQGDIKYGVDVDTFILDSSKVANLQAHMPKGGTKLDITLGVNQDAIFTNFMIFSVDNKGANFDIPAEASDTTKSKLNFPKDREKHFCGCPVSAGVTEEDYYCQHVNISREFYYFIKVQNWGDDDAEKVKVKDELDKNLIYIPGSTEMATDCTPTSDVCTDWTVIPDKDGGSFPLSGEGVTVSAKMKKCNQNDYTCENTILIRYKVKPKDGIAKNYVFNNTAEISDEEGRKEESFYKTNKSFPLKLKPVSCVTDTVCPSPTPEMCGGVRIDSNKECDSANPCPTGYLCSEAFKCVDDPSVTCTDSAVTLAAGKNTPSSDSTIIIPKDNGGEPLVVGQFTLKSDTCDSTKMFNLDSVIVHITTRGNDNNFSFHDYELIYDADGDGIYNDAVDSVISTQESTQFTNYIKFFVRTNAKKYFSSKLNHFLVRTKFTYGKEEIAKDTTFNFYVESYASIGVSDLGTTTVNLDSAPLEFASFSLEPTGKFFIISADAQNSITVPPIAEMNNNIPVLKVRTKSLGSANKITKFKLSVPSNVTARFGDKNGITGVSIWVDTNNDNKGDIKIAEKTKFEQGEGNKIEFREFEQSLEYLENEEKYLLIYVDFNMTSSEPPMTGKIQIPRGALSFTEADTDVYELPVSSKTYTYFCEDGDDTCATPKKKGGCAVTEIETDSTATVVVLVLSVLSLLGLAVRRENLF